MKTVYIATKNPGKVAEFQNFFQDFIVKSLLDLDFEFEIEETGQSFEENALIKANALAKKIGADVLADDSGLEVDALNGRPGIYSARYSGQGDLGNNLKLLAELETVPDHKRTARFVCALAYVTKDLKSIVVRGECEGLIGKTMQGKNGFGYDPLFIVPSLNKTFAELSKEEKAQISHRANALKKLHEVLQDE